MVHLTASIGIDVLWRDRVPITLVSAAGSSDVARTSAAALVYPNTATTAAGIFSGNYQQHSSPSTIIHSSGGAAGGISTTASFIEALETRNLPGITVQVALTSKNAGRLKVLDIKLTDEADPYFYYHLEVGEDDFHALRAEQNLLVDFLQFPHKFIELLEATVNCREDEHPKFLAKLTTSTGRLGSFSIIETNSFKHIIHLSLEFIAGNDAEIKQYLAGLVKDFKAENASLKSQLQSTGSNLSSRLQETEGHVESLTRELESLRLANLERINRINSDHAAELNELKDKYSQLKDSDRRMHDREKQDVESKYQDQINSMSQKLNSLNATHSKMMSHAEHLEKSLSNANAQITSSHDEVMAARNQIERLSVTNGQLESAKKELTAQLTSLRSEIKETEREMRMREENWRRAESNLAVSNDKRSKAEQDMDSLISRNQKLEESLAKASEEINKGNDIIRKLQAELKTSKTKVKLKSTLVAQQDQLLEERATSLEAHAKEAQALKDALGNKNSEIESLKNANEELTKKLQEGKAIIEDNNHVIDWLHKQLNEEALSKPLPATFATRSYLNEVDFDKYAKKNDSVSRASKYEAGMNTSDLGQENHLHRYSSSGMQPNSTSYRKSSPIRNRTSPIRAGLSIPSGYLSPAFPTSKSYQTPAATASHMTGGNNPSMNGSGMATANFSGAAHQGSGVTKTSTGSVDPPPTPAGTRNGTPKNKYSVLDLFLVKDASPEDPITCYIRPSIKAAGEHAILSISREGEVRELGVEESRNVLLPPNSHTVYGIIGIITLLKGTYLIVINKRIKIGTIRGKKIYRVSRVAIFSLSNPSKSDAIFNAIKYNPEIDDSLGDGLEDSPMASVPEDEAAGISSSAQLPPIQHNQMTSMPFSILQNTMGLMSMSPGDYDEQSVFDRRLIAEIGGIFNSETFYFSHQLDITTRFQQQQDEGRLLQKPDWRQMDKRFFWNAHLLESFMPNMDTTASSRTHGLSDWILPIMQGFVQVEECHIGEKPIEFALISRRSKDRSGLRYERRGLNELGQTANFVETEQILTVQIANTYHCVSFVQVRGSIPLFWVQSPKNLKPIPVIKRSDRENKEAMSKHFKDLAQRYGKATAISLIEKIGRESILGQKFSEILVGLNLGPSLNFIEYDFHEQTKGLNYEKLNDFLDTLEIQIESDMKFYWDTGTGQSDLVQRQCRVFRVSCIDCLDRTNVIESLIAKFVLDKIILRLGIEMNMESSKADSLNLDTHHKLLWANNGDAISQAYTGTGALKGDFTRTGKRNIMGIMNDASNSLSRLYQNNFRDGLRQATIDFILGVKELDDTRTIFNHYDGLSANGPALEAEASEPDNENQPLPRIPSRKFGQEGGSNLPNITANLTEGLSVLGKSAVANLTSGLGAVFGMASRQNSRAASTTPKNTQATAEVPSEKTPSSMDMTSKLLPLLSVEHTSKSKPSSN